MVYPSHVGSTPDQNPVSIVPPSALVVAEKYVKSPLTVPPEIDVVPYFITNIDIRNSFHLLK